MEFVLFLCAALSALTGAITGVRAPGVAVRIERASAHAEAVAQRPVRTVAAIVLAQALPVIGAVRTLVTAQPLALSAPVPLFAGRRRE